MILLFYGLFNNLLGLTRMIASCHHSQYQSLSICDYGQLESLYGRYSRIYEALGPEDVENSAVARTPRRFA